VRVSQRKLNFHFKGENYKSCESGDMDSRSPWWWLKSVFKETSEPCLLLRREQKDSCSAVVKTRI